MAPVSLRVVCCFVISLELTKQTQAGWPANPRNPPASTSPAWITSMHHHTQLFCVSSGVQTQVLVFQTKHSNRLSHCFRLVCLLFKCWVLLLIFVFQQAAHYSADWLWSSSPWSSSLFSLVLGLQPCYTVFPFSDPGLPGFTLDLHPTSLAVSRTLGL